MSFGKSFVALAMAALLNISGVGNAAAIEQFVVEQFCPTSPPKGKFVGTAIETRLPSMQKFTGTIEMVLTFCDAASGVSRQDLTFTFGNVSTANDLQFDNFPGVPAPFSGGQSFNYIVGPVVKTVTMVTGQYAPNGSVSATFWGSDEDSAFRLDWTGTFVGGAGGVNANSATSDALQDFVLQEALRFTSVVNPSKFLRAYRSNPVPSGESAQIEFMQAGRGVMTRAQSAGDEFYDLPWGMWASYQYSRYDDDFATTAFDANTHMLLVGADVSPAENVVMGVALGYETTNIQSGFNAGGQDIDGFTVIPYVGALVDIGLMELGLDASLGYSRLDVEQFRTPTGAARVTSSTTSDRWFFSGNANLVKTYGDFNVTARTGLLVARDELDGFTESNGIPVAKRKSALGRFTIGGDMSYFWNGFEPFVSAFYELDFNREDIVTATGPQPANDNDNLLFGGGVRWYSDQGVTAGFEYNTVVGREDFSSDTYSVRLRADF